MRKFNFDDKVIARVIANLGRSFFITGKAGTGKTTLLKEIYNESKARGKNIVVAAPTGVAAMNAGGQTIHSLFGLNTTVFVPGETGGWYHRMDKVRVNVIKKLDILIIDEISMVRCDVMDMIDLRLQHYKRNNKPFGGIQVILFGDLFQLPPVVDNRDKELLYSHYEKDNPFFFSSDVIRRHPLPVFELNKVYRQQDDSFVRILNNIRKGVYLESDVEEINKRLKIGYEPSIKEPGVYLRTKKQDVQAYNNRKLNEIPGKIKTFDADIEGQFCNNDSLCPTDTTLKLKVGAKVMLLRNDNRGKKYVNGTLGIVTSIYNGNVRVLTDERKLITVERTTWKLYKYEWNEQKKSIVPVETGSFTQFPLKLAWAVTIHKSQGMTFDKAIVDAHNSFAPGQVYVALSRCRSLAGLTLTSRITKSDIKVDPKVVEYMKSVERMNSEKIEKNYEKNEQQIFIFSEDGKTITGIVSEASGNIQIPEGVEKIANDAFNGNTKITAIVCPKSLREIGGHAFWNCKKLKEVKLNNGLTSIGVEAFIHTGLEEIELPSTLNYLDWTPFECKMNVDRSNKNFYSDSNGVLYNGDKSSLILFPRKEYESVIVIPDGVTCIESYAFEENCAKEIVIPEGIQELQDSLFSGCQILDTITLRSTKPNNIELSKETFKNFEIEKCVLRVPLCALSDYKSDERFMDFKNIVAIGSYITGQYFTTLPSRYINKSKRFCLYDGKYHCQVVMTSKGLFLQTIRGDYYFLSDLICEYTTGNIWVKNKKESQASYDVIHAIDGKTAIPFGHFTENYSTKTLTYRDLKTGEVFTIDLESGKII